MKKKEWLKNKDGDYVYQGDKGNYMESRQALPTSRLLDCSSDCGYWAEYKGYGTIDDVPVIAIYLLDWDEESVEDEGDYDWDKALNQGRIILDIDQLSDECGAEMVIIESREI